MEQLQDLAGKKIKYNRYTFYVYIFSYCCGDSDGLVGRSEMCVCPTVCPDDNLTADGVRMIRMIVLVILPVCVAPEHMELGVLEVVVRDLLTL